MPPLHLFLLTDGWMRVTGAELQVEHDLRVQIQEDPDGRMRVRQVKLNALAAPRAITTADLRQVPIAQIEGVVNARRGRFSAGDTLTVTNGDQTDDSDYRLGSRPGPDGLTEEFLRKVARAYVAAVQRGERPNQAMSEQTGAPLKTVQRWVYTARLRGIMPRGSRGRSG